MLQLRLRGPYVEGKFTDLTDVSTIYSMVTVAEVFELFSVVQTSNLPRANHTRKKHTEKWFLSG